MPEPPTYIPEEYNINSKLFNTRQLPTFSPFKIVEVKSAAAKTKAGRDYTKFIVSISPSQNSAVRIQVEMNRDDLDKIRSVLTMSKDPANQAINATPDGVNARGYAVIKFSGAMTPS